MILRKNEYPRRSISLGAASGQAGWSAGLFLLLFLAVFLQACIQLEIYRTTALYLEDALAASGLASAVIDVEEYGISHRILIDDPEDAYQRYRWAIKGNLNLNEAWEGKAGSIVQGPVRITNYTVYNVLEDSVMIYSYDEAGQTTKRQDFSGNVTAPDGRAVEATSVYGEISFWVKGVLGTTVEAHKGCLVDIVR